MSADQGLDARVQQVFGALGEPVVLRKDLATSLPGTGHVPRYVAEFLLARRTAEADRAVAAVGDYLREHHPVAHERDLWLHRLIQQGALRVVDRLSVRANVRSGQYDAEIPSLSLSGIRLSADLVEEHRGLLTGGVWGLIDLTWELGGMRIRRFWPVQVRVRLEQYLEGRHYFTARQWIDLMVTSAGYDPDELVADLGDDRDRLRRKLLLLSRLVPLVEPNVNMLELGPRNTGKTYLARNVSPHAFVISGGRATPANLFVNLRTGAPGVLVQRGVVIFDEVARLQLGSDDAVATLKDFMESGRFSRGSRELQSGCSIVLLGNIDVDNGQPARHYRHFCEPLPRELRDTALIDRLHAFVPGWEMPKLRTASFARGVGFVSDYFGSVLFALRDHAYDGLFAQMTAGRRLVPGATTRDENAVRRVGRGLCKIVFPAGRADGEGDVLEAVLSLAGELRQRLHEQLCVMAPGEFRPRVIGYQDAPAAAEDLGRSARPRPSLRMRVGEVYFLDGLGEEMGGQVLTVAATVLPGGRGLQIRGRVPQAAAEGVRIAYSFLSANLRRLSLPSDWLQERQLAVQIVGGDVHDGQDVALPACLAMASALRQVAPAAVCVAAGAATIHGALVAPSRLGERLAALDEVMPGGLLVLARPAQGGRARAVPAMPDGWTAMRCASLEEALAAI